MKRTKIAPMLSRLFCEATNWMEIVEYAPARAELRALLAVARAARWALTEPDQIARVNRVGAALARLDRVSKAG